MLMEPFFIMYLNMFIKRKQKENKMKQNKYLEKIAFLIEGITSYNVAKNKHNSENEKRHALGLHPEKLVLGEELRLMQDLCLQVLLVILGAGGLVC